MEELSNISKICWSNTCKFSFGYCFSVDVRSLLIPESPGFSRGEYVNGDVVVAFAAGLIFGSLGTGFVLCLFMGANIDDGGK